MQTNTRLIDKKNGKKKAIKALNSISPSFFKTFVIILLTSANLPAAHLQENNKKEPSVCKQAKCSYQAYQKNRLAYFAEHDGFIWFDTTNNYYTYFLSNFYPASLNIWELKFYSADAAFKAAKFLDKPEFAVQFTHLRGDEAFKLARKYSYQQRNDWFKVREGIMLEVVRAKFKQHPELSELLLATGKAYIAAHCNCDSFWTDGGDGKGKNKLGEILMIVRGENGGTGIVPKPPKYQKFVTR
jgi:N-glycosidase YbiA